MDFAEEVEEYKELVKTLSIQENILSITTLENIQIRAELTSQGVFVLSSSSDCKNNYDDVGQMLNEVSPAYRKAFSEQLLKKLSAQSTS